MDAATMGNTNSTPLSSGNNSSHNQSSSNMNTSSSDSSGYGSATTTPTNPASVGSTSSSSSSSGGGHSIYDSHISPTPSRVATVAPVVQYVHHETYQHPQLQQQQQQYQYQLKQQPQPQHQQQYQQQQLPQHMQSHTQQQQLQHQQQQYHQTHAYPISAQPQFGVAYNSAFTPTGYQQSLFGNIANNPATASAHAPVPLNEQNLAAAVRQPSGFYGTTERHTASSKFLAATSQSHGGSNGSVGHDDAAAGAKIYNKYTIPGDVGHTTKPQATAIPFYAQQLHSGTSTMNYTDHNRHKLPAKLPSHSSEYSNYFTHYADTAAGTSFATQPQQQQQHQQHQQYQPYHAVTKPLQENVYAAATLKPQNTVSNTRNAQLNAMYGVGVGFNPSGFSNTNSSFYQKNDKYLYAPPQNTSSTASLSALPLPNSAAYAAPTAPTATSLIPPQYHDLPTDSYRKPSSWHWSMDYAGGACRTLPPPGSMQAASIPPANTASYLSPSAATRDIYHAHEKYTNKYDKYNSYYHHQQYMSGASGRSVWPSPNPQPHPHTHLASISDRLSHPHSTHPTLTHSAASAGSINPAPPPPSLSYHFAPPTHNAASSSTRQSCCSQPYQQQSCFYPRAPHLLTNAYNPQTQPVPFVQQESGNSINAKHSMLDYTHHNKKSTKATNDLHSTSPSAYDAVTHLNHHYYSTTEAPAATNSSQQFHNTADTNVGSHSPINAPLHSELTSTFYNDLNNIQSTYDNYGSTLSTMPPTHQSHHNAIPRPEQLPPSYPTNHAKSTLLEYHKQLASPTNADCYLTEPTLINLDDHIVTTSSNYENFGLVHNLSANNSTAYAKAHSEEGVEKSAATKNYANLRDFLSTWNEDEEDYGSTEELRFVESEMQQVHTVPELDVATANEAASNYLQENIATAITETPPFHPDSSAHAAGTVKHIAEATSQPPIMDNNDLQFKSSFSLHPKIHMGITDDNTTDSESNQFANLPDLLIDVKKPNNITPVLPTVRETAEAAVDLKDIKDISYGSFDVEKELDEMRTRRAQCTNEALNSRVESVIIKRDAIANELKTKHQTDDMEAVAVPKNNSVQILSVEHFTTNERKEVSNVEENNEDDGELVELSGAVQAKDQSAVPQNTCHQMRSIETEGTNSSNSSTFEKEYETFINKIGTETDVDLQQVDSNTATFAKHQMDELMLCVDQTLQFRKNSESDHEFSQKIESFSKFYKRKRKYPENLNGTQNKKVKSLNESTIVTAEHINFPRIYTKHRGKRVLSETYCNRRNFKSTRCYSYYSRIKHSLRRFYLNKMKVNTAALMERYIAKLNERHLPLIKRQSIKQYGSRFEPKTLKSLTVGAVNTQAFRDNLLSERSLGQSKTKTNEGFMSDNWDTKTPQQMIGSTENVVESQEKSHEIGKRVEQIHFQIETEVPPNTIEDISNKHTDTKIIAESDVTHEEAKKTLDDVTVKPIELGTSDKTLVFLSEEKSSQMDPDEIEDAEEYKEEATKRSKLETLTTTDEINDFEAEIALLKIQKPTPILQPEHAVSPIPLATEGKQQTDSVRIEKPSDMAIAPDDKDSKDTYSFSNEREFSNDNMIINEINVQCAANKPKSSYLLNIKAPQSDDISTNMALKSEEKSSLPITKDEENVSIPFNKEDSITFDITSSPLNYVAGSNIRKLSSEILINTGDFNKISTPILENLNEQLEAQQLPSQAALQPEETSKMKSDILVESLQVQLSSSLPQELNETLKNESENFTETFEIKNSFQTIKKTLPNSEASGNCVEVFDQKHALQLSEAAQGQIESSKAKPVHCTEMIQGIHSPRSIDNTMQCSTEASDKSSSKLIFEDCSELIESSYATPGKYSERFEETSAPHTPEQRNDEINTTSSQSHIALLVENPPTKSSHDLPAITQGVHEVTEIFMDTSENKNFAEVLKDVPAFEEVAKIAPLEQIISQNSPQNVIPIDEPLNTETEQEIEQPEEKYTPNVCKIEFDCDDSSRSSTDSSSSSSSSSYSTDSSSSSSSSSSSDDENDDDDASSTTTEKSCLNEMEELEKELSQHKIKIETEVSKETPADSKITVTKALCEQVATNDDIEKLKKILESVSEELEQVKNVAPKIEVDLTGDDEVNVIKIEDESDSEVESESIRKNEKVTMNENAVEKVEPVIPDEITIESTTKMETEVSDKNVCKSEVQANTEVILLEDKILENRGETVPSLKTLAETFINATIATVTPKDVEMLSQHSSQSLMDSIPKLSDLCKNALGSSFENTADSSTLETIDDRGLSVEEALAEMYRQAGVFSDPEDGDVDEKDTQDVVLINLEEILVNDSSDVYVLQCDMNENVLSVVAQTQTDLIQGSAELDEITENNAEEVSVLQVLNDGNEQYIQEYGEDEHLTTLDVSETTVVTTNEEEFHAVGLNNLVDDTITSQDDLPSIHHEEIVPENYRRFNRQILYNRLREKYVLKRNHLRTSPANRVLKKYIHRWIVQIVIAYLIEKENKRVKNVKRRAQCERKKVQRKKIYPKKSHASKVEHKTTSTTDKIEKTEIVVLGTDKESCREEIKAEVKKTEVIKQANKDMEKKVTHRTEKSSYKTEKQLQKITSEKVTKLQETNIGRKKVEEKKTDVLKANKEARKTEKAVHQTEKSSEKLEGELRISKKITPERMKEIQKAIDMVKKAQRNENIAQLKSKNGEKVKNESHSKANEEKLSNEEIEIDIEAEIAAKIDAKIEEERKAALEAAFKAKTANIAPNIFNMKHEFPLKRTSELMVYGMVSPHSICESEKGRFVENTAGKTSRVAISPTSTSSCSVSDFEGLDSETETLTLRRPMQTLRRGSYGSIADRNFK